MCSRLHPPLQRAASTPSARPAPPDRSREADRVPTATLHPPQVGQSDLLGAYSTNTKPRRDDRVCAHPVPAADQLSGTHGSVLAAFPPSRSLFRPGRRGCSPLSNEPSSARRDLAIESRLLPISARKAASPGVASVQLSGAERSAIAAQVSSDERPDGGACRFAPCRVLGRRGIGFAYATVRRATAHDYAPTVHDYEPTASAAAARSHANGECVRARRGDGGAFAR
jgi:hypothetical protein